jgi:hypothetical protein
VANLNPSRTEQHDFLLRLYFGSGDDFLDLCLKRAYLDLSRTIHGIREYPKAFFEAKQFLHKELLQFSNQHEIYSLERFDAWHEVLCQNLVSIYNQHGYAFFYVGQAQKWINMTFKYVYVFGKEKLPGFSSFYDLCHMPIDNIMIKNLAVKRPPVFTRAWSRIESYEEYMQFQRWVRKTFENSSPLAVEFWLWQESPNTA